MVRIDIKLLIANIGMAAFFSSTPIITSHGNHVRLGAQREVCMMIIMMALRLRARAISVPHV